jgi:hypothetical protein
VTGTIVDGDEEDDEQTVADRIALPGQLLLPGMPSTDLRLVYDESRNGGSSE